MTCHDGFTLNDLVSYDRKHNEANGEAEPRRQRRQPVSWDCGVEGPSDDPAIEALRERQVRNLLAIELLSVGVPMLLMGDEVRRTQAGNNNAYCHDERASWFDWRARRAACRPPPLLRRTDRRAPRGCGPSSTRRRTSRWPSCSSGRAWSCTGRASASPTPATSRARSPSHAAGEQLVLHVIFNACWEPLAFELPAASGHQAWRRIVDTSLSSPHDLASAADAAPVEGDSYPAGPRSVVVLAARRTAERGAERQGARRDDRSGPRRHGARADGGSPATRGGAGLARARGTGGARTWPSAAGARCARTTAPTATRGRRSRTTTPGRGPTAGTRTGWRASPTCSGA